MYFCSENYDAADPAILKALVKSNKGFVPSYGEDEYTQKAKELLQHAFGRSDIEVFFCFNGTGANNFALGSIAQRHTAVLCSDVSHLYTAESTAPETFTGCRLYPVKSINGKISVADLLSNINRSNGVHLPPAAVLTITQPTEYGTVYSREELQEISRCCKKYQVLLHIDGARLFNALAATEGSLSEFAKLSAADVITLGGTKSGLLFGEAVVFFNSKRFANLPFQHKRSMQLASKNRFIAAQFCALLKNDYWKQLASKTNSLATYCAKKLADIHNTQAAYPVETNMVFLAMSTARFNKLQKMAHFYRWDEERKEVRLVFSLSNTRADIDHFLEAYKRTFLQ